VEVVISDEAREFVRARGGAVFIRASARKCCGGALVTLDASTTAPRDVRGFSSYPAEDIDVYYSGSPRGLPQQLLIEMRGVVRRHLAAFKDGCVYGA
jgi:hypothetical protein